MLAKHILLITGGNAGLGFETVKALYQTNIPYEIILGSRSVEKGEKAVEVLKSEIPNSHSTISVLHIDVSSDESIEKAFKEVTQKYDKLDTLINNAGGTFDNEIGPGKMSLRESWNKTYDLNVVSTQIVTSTFIPLLLKSSDPRLLFITSGTSSLNETYDARFPFNNAIPKGWPKPDSRILLGYRASKTGLNMVIRDWCRVLKEDGVKVLGISPGFLATGLGGEDLRKLGALDPSIGGNFIKDVVEGKRDADVGKIIRRDGIQPW